MTIQEYDVAIREARCLESVALTAYQQAVEERQRLEEAKARLIHQLAREAHSG